MPPKCNCKFGDHLWKFTLLYGLPESSDSLTGWCLRNQDGGRISEYLQLLTSVAMPTHDLYNTNILKIYPKGMANFKKYLHSMSKMWSLFHLDKTTLRSSNFTKLRQLWVPNIIVDNLNLDSNEFRQRNISNSKSNIDIISTIAILIYFQFRSIVFYLFLINRSINVDLKINKCWLKDWKSRVKDQNFLLKDQKCQFISKMLI